jgi:chaperonin GroEL
MKMVRRGTVAEQVLAASLRRSARAIAPSLGPNGRGVLSHRPPAPPRILTDGYSIARDLADEAGPGSLGARLLKETLFELDRDLGDGTATAALVLEALLTSGQRVVRFGFPSGELAEALTAATRDLAERAEAFRLEMSRESWAAGVARTAGADEGLAAAIVPAFLELGADGLLQVEEGHGTKTEVLIRAGTTVDATLASRLLSDAADCIFLRLERPHILVADEEISDFGKLLPILEGFAARNKPLLVVARDVSGAALEALVRNKMQGGLRVAALKISDVVERGYEALEDLAIAVGAALVSDRLGSSLATLRPQMLGRAEAAEISREGALVVGGSLARQGNSRPCRSSVVREQWLAVEHSHREDGG